MQMKSLPFPSTMPMGYECYVDDVQYDPEKHLALEFPDTIWTLNDFGYSDHQISQCASSVAVTAPFRLLSDSGLDALYNVVTRLKDVRSELSGNRTPSHLAGGVYRSLFLRDMCACTVIQNHMSSIAGTRLITHSMPSQQIYVNYAPEDISKAVDSWHFDGIGFDYVVMVTDPQTLKGGKFQFFKGTRDEIASQFNMDVKLVRKGITDELDPDRVMEIEFPKAGYAIFQQGNLVVHRATRMLEPGERITVVPGLVSESTHYSDPTAIHDMVFYRENGIKAELARHAARLAQGKLADLINDQEMDAGHDSIVSSLENAVSDISALLYQLENAKSTQNGRY